MSISLVYISFLLTGSPSNKMLKSFHFTLAFFVLLFIIIRPVSASLPLCSMIHASSNGNFQFTVPSGPSLMETDAAIVLSAGAGLGEDLTEPFFINASYVTPTGIPIQQMGNNVVTVPFVQPHTDIEVTLYPEMVNGILPTDLPFTFVSYYANFPICFIGLTPYQSFRAFMPAYFKTATGAMAPAFAYFVVNVPSTFNAAIITVSGNPAPAESIFVIPQGVGTEGGNLIYKSKDAIAATGRLTFAYTPGVAEVSQSTQAATFEVEITVEYTNTKNPAKPQTTKAPTTPSPSQNASHSSSGSGSSFTWFKVTLVVLALWYFSTAYYNYTSYGIQEFPLMFPFGERMALFLSTYGICNAPRREYQDLEATRI